MARRRTRRGRNERPEAAPQAFVSALYIRVSTEKQADEGYSLADQEARLRAHCVAQGWDVDDAHVYVDEGISGKSADRPRFQAMLAAARAGVVCRVVALKLDRLARNVRDFLALVDDLRRWGCHLVLIKETFDTSTPQGKFALTMFAAMAELEAATITERVMTGKRQKAQEGGWNGAPVPRGYSYDGEVFHVDDAGAGIVRQVFERFDAGAPQRQIARELTHATGRTWHSAQVGYILRNGFYAGLVQWDGVETEGNHPAIVDRDLFERVQQRGQWPARVLA